MAIPYAMQFMKLAAIVDTNQSTDVSFNNQGYGSQRNNHVFPRMHS